MTTKVVTEIAKFMGSAAYEQLEIAIEEAFGAGYKSGQQGEHYEGAVDDYMEGREGE